MPTYEYECKSCGVRFERKQKWHDDPVKECPECQGELRKVIHPAGIVFKGSGFYKTDYASSGSRQERAAADGKPAEKPAAKTDDTPAAKTEATKPSDDAKHSASESKRETGEAKRESGGEKRET